MATLVGAIAGGVAGYMIFTPQGRELRRRIEPAIEDFAQELNNFRSALARAGGMANQGWRMLNDVLDEASSARYTSPHQTTPF
jgi:hypothetical protein